MAEETVNTVVSHTGELKLFKLGRKTLYCGFVDGYAVSARVAGKSCEVTVESSGVAGFGALADKLLHGKYGEFRVINATIRDDYLEFALAFEGTPTVADIKDAVLVITPMLRENWFEPKRLCALCKGEGSDIGAYHNEAFRVMHLDCHRRAVERQAKKARGRKGPLPVLGAFLGALCTALVFAVVLHINSQPYRLIFAAGTVISWAAYTLLGGASGKGSAVLASACSLLAVALGELAFAVITGVEPFLHFSDWESLGFSLIFWAVGTALFMPRMLKSAHTLEGERRALIQTEVPLPEGFGSNKA